MHRLACRRSRGNLAARFCEMVHQIDEEADGIAGTHTGMVFTEPGAQIRADYGPLGRVEVSFPR